jgi:hypothetical protein
LFSASGLGGFTHETRVHGAHTQDRQIVFLLHSLAVHRLGAWITIMKFISERILNVVLPFDGTIFIHIYAFVMQQQILIIMYNKLQ